MSTSRFLTVLLFVVMALAALSGPVAAQGTQPTAPDAPLSTAFSYQGSLRSGGAPASGAFDFQFILYNAASGGGQVSATVALEDVAVSNGNFTVALDFGAAAFDGQARWLQVGVRPGASTGAYSILSPRHALTAVPYALYARNAWSLTGNAGTAPGTNFLGTTDNQALELKVNGQRALRLEPATLGTLYGPNVIAGHSGNSVASGQNSQTIAGGGSAALQCGASGADPCTNKVMNNYGTVGGGGGNTASGDWATVGGGKANTAGGYYATVGGGNTNTASGESATVGGGSHNAVTKAGDTVAGGGHNTASGGDATVGGGYTNTASGLDATVGGGDTNTASGSWATVAGGYNNIAIGLAATVAGGGDNAAGGDYSFAAGRRAKANGRGSFVWADSTDEDWVASQADTFRVRAGGGVWFQTKSSDFGFSVYNTTDDTPADNGSAMQVVANVSKGNLWPNGGAALWAINLGTSAAIHADSRGTYSGYFEDNIYVEGDCVGCTLAYVAVNSGGGALQVGDVVAADGVRPPLASEGQPVLAVHRAAADGAVGVVAGRAVLVESRKDGKTSVSAEAADGAIAAGDYLFIVVSGLAQARVDASAAPITAGQRLTTAATPGNARALRTVSVEGVSVAEAAPVIGVALESLPAGEGLIWILVAVH